MITGFPDHARVSQRTAFLHMATWLLTNETSKRLTAPDEPPHDSSPPLHLLTHHRLLVDRRKLRMLLCALGALLFFDVEGGGGMAWLLPSRPPTLLPRCVVAVAGAWGSAKAPEYS